MFLFLYAANICNLLFDIVIFVQRHQHGASKVPFYVLF